MGHRCARFPPVRLEETWITGVPDSRLLWSVFAMLMKGVNDRALAVNVCFILNLILCAKNEKHHRHRKCIATQSYLGEAAAVRALLLNPTWV